MILSRDPVILDGLRRLRSHGMTSTSWAAGARRALGYDVTDLGYNYRMDELRAAIGQAQLKHLASWNEKRRQLTGGRAGDPRQTLSTDAEHRGRTARSRDEGAVTALDRRGCGVQPRRAANR